jgi:hypothetical protein
MSWTKEQLIDEAFAELRLAGYTFDITPEEKQTALRRMDTMMATWEAKGVRVGYPLPSSPDDSNISDDSGLPDSATEAVFLNLAKRLAPGFGKQLSAQTLSAARDAYDTLLWAAARPPQQQLPSTTPRGAGNRPWRNAVSPFFPVPETDPLTLSAGGDLDIQE